MSATLREDAAPQALFLRGVWPTGGSPGALAKLYEAGWQASTRWMILRGVWRRASRLGGAAGLRRRWRTPTSFGPRSAWGAKALEERGWSSTACTAERRSLGGPAPARTRLRAGRGQKRGRRRLTGRPSRGLGWGERGYRFGSKVPE